MKDILTFMSANPWLTFFFMVFVYGTVTAICQAAIYIVQEFRK